MGVWFSLLITVTYGLIFNSVQANTVTIAFENAFGLERTIVGALLAVLVAVIIFGGIKSISRITEMIVPPMAIVYIGVAVLLLLKLRYVTKHFHGNLQQCIRFRPSHRWWYWCDNQVRNSARFIRNRSRYG